MVAAVPFGFNTHPVLSLQAARAHDFAMSNRRVEIFAALIFFFAPGALAIRAWRHRQPISRLVGYYGPGAPFVIVALPAISG